MQKLSQTQRFGSKVIRYKWLRVVEGSLVMCWYSSTKEKLNGNKSINLQAEAVSSCLRIVAHYCPVLLPLDDVNVLALTGVVRGEGLAGWTATRNVSNLARAMVAPMLVGAEGKGYLKIDVENLIEIKRKGKSLPVQDSTTPIPGSYPSTPN